MSNKKKTHTHSRSGKKDRILPLCVKLKKGESCVGRWEVKVSAERKMTRPRYAWSRRALVARCQSSRRQAENEHGSGEDGEMRQESCSLPFLSRKKYNGSLSKKQKTKTTSATNQTDRGKLVRAARCEACLHLHNWRRLKCMLVTVTTVQWARLFSSHVTHRGDRYRRLAWLSFLLPPLWPEVSSLKVGAMHIDTRQRSPSARLTAPPGTDSWNPP